MGFDYMLFDEALRDRFVNFAGRLGIASAVRKDEIAGFVVTLPDGLDNAQQAAIDYEYEAIMNEQMLRAEADEELVSHHAFGVTVTRADGTSGVVRLPPAIARRLLQHFAADEVHEIVGAIAHSLENPVDGPICRKPAE
jgi:hypothetical protein